MSKPIDMTGQRFGRLTVIEKSERRDASRGLFWLCKCDCGTYIEVRAMSLRKGDTQSCGCLREEATHKNAKIAVAARLQKMTPKEEPILDEEPPADDDLWMFGTHKDVARLQKMFY